MPETLIGLKILLLLLPGFLMLLIQENLGEKKERTQVEKIFVILLYDIFVFLIYLGVSKFVPNLKPFILGIKEEKLDIIGSSFFNIAFILIVASFLGILFGIFNIYGWHYNLLRKFKLTYKTGRSSVWNDAFYEKQGYYVIVHLDGGVRIFGWISDFSTDPNPKYLFIREAKYLGMSPEEEVVVNGPGVLVTNEAKIKLIEFLTPE